MQGAIAEMQHLDGRPRFRGFPLYELPALQQVDGLPALSLCFCFRMKFRV